MYLVVNHFIEQVMTMKSDISTLSGINSVIHVFNYTSIIKKCRDKIN